MPAGQNRSSRKFTLGTVCLNKLSYFHTKNRLSVLKELCVNQAEEQRIMIFDPNFVEQKLCKHCIEQKRSQNWI